MSKFIGASDGIAIAKVFVLKHVELSTEKIVITDIAAEIKKYDDAIVAAKADLEKLQKVAHEKMGADSADIFAAHLQILQDPAMENEVKEKIRTEKFNAASMTYEVAQKYYDMFASMCDAYFKERAADIKDVTTRIIKHILGVPTDALANMDEDSIVVAEDLTPSDTAQLNEHVKGFVTAIGGRTSHSAIMARTLQIPAIVGASTILEDVVDGDVIAMDGSSSAKLLINPTADEIKTFKNVAEEYAKELIELKKLIDVKTMTKCGKHVEIAGNIGKPDDASKVVEFGGEGVGLFRSEFLYMESKNWPTEEEQFQSYKEALEIMGDKPIVIRTLDIGGDKHLDYFDFPEEMNPFLGYRAIRLCLDKAEIFRTQLRALLRASKFGNLRIMFPLIATIEEFKDAKVILDDEAAKLLSEGHELGNYQVGMMMEVPSAVFLADKFAKYADFFSVGSNDLLQYSFAADRMSKHVSYLYQPLNPAVLKALKILIDAAHKEGKWVGMCGEMAGTPEAVKILLGLGLDEFSMSASSMLKARKIINSTTMDEARKLANSALECETEEEVLKLVSND